MGPGHNIPLVTPPHRPAFHTSAGILLSLSVALTLSACDTEKTPVEPPETVGPLARIVAPAGDTFFVGDTIRLRGSAVTGHGESLPDEALCWYLDDSPDPFGQGPVQELLGLERGPHDVALIATDSAGMADTASKALHIVRKPPPPALWSLKTDSELSSAPALAQDGTLFFPLLDSLYAIDAHSGTVLWKRQVETFVRGIALGDDGNLYISGAMEGGGPNLLSYTPGGDLRWSHDAAHRLHGIPAIGANGWIYYGVRGAAAEGAGVWAIDPDGLVRWTVERSYRGGTVVVLGDSVYAGDTGVYYALDAGSGAILMEMHSPSATGHLLGFAALGADGTYYPNDRGIIEAFGSDGRLLWHYRAAYDGWAAPAIARDGTLYVGRGDGSLLALTPNGSVKWTFTPDPPVSPPQEELPYAGTTPALGVSGTIYHSAGEYLFAITADGEEIWRFATGNSDDPFWVPSPLLSHDGILYVPSTNGVLFALDVGDPLDVAAPWPMIARGPRHSGRLGGP